VSFDSVAPWYRTLETIAFGGVLQRCRIACLDELQNPRRALIVGEGNGRFLCELLRTHPDVEIECVDASQRMLLLARQRLERELPDRANQVRLIVHDIASWPAPERHYDLVVTHFVLDCFPESELAEIVKRLSRAATNEANWLLADFRVRDKGIARLRSRLWLAAMYGFFRLAAGISARELIDPAPLMQSEGFALARQHLFRNGMLKSELWRKISPGSAGCQPAPLGSLPRGSSE
jgi:ubiquinone/menaquinone biosynthesis C-methylase UbiE